jgi:hypothetical protein
MSAVSNVFAGSCHCGAIGFTFRASEPPDRWQVRACQCSFCRGHGARTTSDPAGAVSFRIDDESQLHRYRFGLRSADFLVCRTCGVYIASVMSSSRGRFATVNINALRAPIDVADAVPMKYDDESLEQKQRRREERWTPVVEEFILQLGASESDTRP